MSLSGGVVTLSPKKPVGKKRKQDRAVWYYLGEVGQIGFTIAFTIVIGIAVGSYIDSRFQTAPKGILSGIFLGLGISVMYLISVVRMVR